MKNSLTLNKELSHTITPIHTIWVNWSDKYGSINKLGVIKNGTTKTI
jgi:hypothetical protein